MATTGQGVVAHGINKIKLEEMQIDPPGPGVDLSQFLPKTGFALGGTLTDGTLTVNAFTAFDPSTPPAGYTFLWLRQARPLSAH